MRRVSIFIILAWITFGLIGCYTVPRHLVQEQEINYYYIDEIIVNDPIYDPLPIPEPPPPVVTNPHRNNPVIPRNDQSDNSRNSGSYGKRDPLSGDINRNSGETRTNPPVRKPEQNDRVQ